MHRLFFVVASVTWCVVAQQYQLHGSIVVTPDRRFVSNLCVAIASYAEEHAGELPARWEDLQPYTDVESLGRYLATPPKDRYKFHRARTQPPEPGDLVLVATSPMRDGAGNLEGRWIIWRPDGGEVHFRWLTEDQVQRLLNPGTQPPFGSPPAERVGLTVQVTNPNATLSPGEPLCIRVNASAPKEEIPDYTSFRLQVTGPGGTHEAPLRDYHLLGRSWTEVSVSFTEASSNQLAATFHAVLLPLLDPPKEIAELDSIPVLTAQAGDYVVKVKEMLSQSESVPASFRVVTGSQDDSQAAALFTSKAGLETFLGRSDNLSAYETLIVNYPNSRYAAYASFILGRLKFHQLAPRVTGPAEDPAVQQQAAGVAALGSYFDRALTLGFPSLFEAHALSYKAQCLIYANRPDDSKAVFRELINKYDGVFGLEHEIKTAKQALDTTPPSLSILGDNPATAECGFPYADAGARALDDVAGNRTGWIVVSRNVNTSVLGTYSVTYTVSDRSDNTTNAVRDAEAGVQRRRRHGLRRGGGDCSGENARGRVERGRSDRPDERTSRGRSERQPEVGKSFPLAWRGFEVLRGKECTQCFSARAQQTQGRCETGLGRAARPNAQSLLQGIRHG
jgi:hypothetical protein